MWFDRGLVCIAYAAGPNYNKSWRLFTPDDRASTVVKELRVLNLLGEVDLNASPLEKALIAALAARFPGSENMNPHDMTQFNAAYAEAMHSVYQEYSDDLDVTTLFADAIMCVRPRALWNVDTGKPTTAEVVEARAVLEKALVSPSGRNHPGLCHLYILMMEISPFPEAALTAADRLRRIVPDGSHMQHMATHIEVACSNYRHSIVSNYDAVYSDDRYFADVKVESLLYTIYRSRNIHALAAATATVPRSNAT